MVWNLNPPFAKVKGSAWPWLEVLRGNTGRALMLTPTAPRACVPPAFFPLTRLTTLLSRLFRKTETTVGGVLRVFRWRLPLDPVMEVCSRLVRLLMVPTAV